MTDDLLAQLKARCRREGRKWRFEEWSVRIPVPGSSRFQTVHIGLDGNDCVLTTTVLGTARVTTSDDTWRNLALTAWKWNALHELVAFVFDSRNRLVGQIRHPAAFLDLDELDLYIKALSRVSDRFEYLLTGQDRF